MDNRSCYSYGTQVIILLPVMRFLSPSLSHTLSRSLSFPHAAGQERFRCMTRSYFRKVDGILLMYDVSNEKSFMSVRSWMVDIKSNATSPTTITGESIQIPVILIGNKVDLREAATPETSSLFISSDAGSAAAHEYGATAFAEISVKSGDYVDHALTALVVKMMATEDTLIKSNGTRDSSVLSLSGRSFSWKDKMSCCSK